MREPPSKRMNHDPVLELGVALQHVVRSDAPDFARVDAAMRAVLRAVPRARRMHVSAMIVRACVRELVRDFLAEDSQ